MSRDVSIEPLVAELASLLSDRVSVGAAVRDHHSHGESYHRSHPPDVVVFPQSTEDVVGVVKICARHGAPIVPFGAGTSLEGHVGAVRGGVSVDMRRMSRAGRMRVGVIDVAMESGEWSPRRRTRLCTHGLA